MSLTLAPYAEKIVSDYLRAVDDLEALGCRVVGKTPDSTSEPWIRVTQLDDRAIGGIRADTHHEFYFQFDCYAGKDGGQPEANLLGRTTRAALVDAPNHNHTGASISGVDIRSHARIPDLDVAEPARERMILTATIYMRTA